MLYWNQDISVSIPDQVYMQDHVYMHSGHIAMDHPYIKNHQVVYFVLVNHHQAIEFLSILFFSHHHEHAVDDVIK